MSRAAAILLALLACVLALAGGAAPRGGPSGWLSYGNGSARTSATAASVSPHLRARWSVKLQGRVTAQPLVVGTGGRATIYVATSAGLVYALRADGRIRWRARLGRLAKHPCPQMDGYGVSGTPVADPRSRVLYAVDALGRLHALDLATGVERPRWPVQLYPDYRDELVWGALAEAGGSVYAATGSYCDARMVAKVIRVETATRRVSQWVVVPASLGGGGGIWGWGGLAYDADRRSLLAVTGNALRGGSNVGKSFREWAGFGEHLVELAPDLRVRASNHPKGIHAPVDLDFVGSPVILRPPGCGAVVAALNKDGRVYAWRGGAIGRGPAWSLRVEKTGAPSPLITQPAVWARGRSILVVAAARVTRVAVTRSCGGRIAWSRISPASIDSTPTVAGPTLWFVRWHGTARLLGLDLRTGRQVARRTLDRDKYFVAPTAAGGRLYLASWDGLVRALG